MTAHLRGADLSGGGKLRPDCIDSYGLFISYLLIMAHRLPLQQVGVRIGGQQQVSGPPCVIDAPPPIIVNGGGTIISSEGPFEGCSDVSWKSWTVIGGAAFLGRMPIAKAVTVPGSA